MPGDICGQAWAFADAQQGPSLNCTSNPREISKVLSIQY